MYVVISVISAIVPMLIVVLLWRLLFKVLKSVLEKGGTRADRINLPQEEHEKVPDLAAEFERKLKEKRQSTSEPVLRGGSDVYREPVEPATVVAEQENWRPAAAVTAIQEKQQPKVRFNHQTLVNGFIMSEILDKPRSIKPYDGNF